MDTSDFFKVFDNLILTHTDNIGGTIPESSVVAVKTSRLQRALLVSIWVEKYRGILQKDRLRRKLSNTFHTIAVSDCKGDLHVADRKSYFIGFSFFCVNPCPSRGQRGVPMLVCCVNKKFFWCRSLKTTGCLFL